MRILVIDIGGTYTKIGLVSNWKVVHRTKMKTSKNLDFLKEIIENYGNIDGVSIAFAGVVRKNEIILSPHLNNEGKRLEFNTGIPVIVENDANMFAYGEFAVRKGKFKNLVGITLGTGVGGGIVMEGKLLRGNGFAGEFGHTVMDIHGKKCKCGKNGCIETFLGEDYFKEEWGTAEELLKRAKTGDENALEFWKNYGMYLAYALSNVIHSVSPQIIVLGGGISYAHEYFKESLHEHLLRLNPYFDKTECRIEVSTLKEDAVFIGGYALHQRLS